MLARSRTPSPCASMRCSMPRIHAGRVDTARARSSAASTTATVPSVMGAMSRSRRGSFVTGRASTSSTVTSPERIASGFDFPLRCAPGRDPREILLVPISRLEVSARLERRHVDHRRPQRQDVIGVGLQRHDLVKIAGRRLAEPVHERAVDLAGLDRDPRLVQRPRRVHLDVALTDRWPRAHGVETHDKRERPALQIVQAPRTGEADLVARDAGRRHRVARVGPIISVSLCTTSSAVVLHAKLTTATSLTSNPCTSRRGRRVRRWVPTRGCWCGRARGRRPTSPSRACPCALPR